MSLEGKLKDFGIADILQLLAQQQKTGILLVERQSESAEIYFLKGQIVETRSSQHSDRLGEMLVRGGYVTRQQIETALDRQGDTFDYLGGMLVRDGLIKHAVLQQALFTQMSETFFDILQWRDGQYRFITDKFKKEGVLENIPGVQSMLLDVLRMIDEWPEISKIISSFDLIFELQEGHSPEDIEIDELPVYQLIDGRRSVREIVDGSLLGRYAACKILVELLQDGIIKPAGKKSVSPLKKRRNAVDLILGPGAYILLPALFAAVALFTPVDFPSSVLPDGFRDGRRHRLLYAYDESMRRQRLIYAIEAYRLMNAAYPATLDELVTTGLVPSVEFSAPFHYAITGRHYDLTVTQP